MSELESRDILNSSNLITVECIDNYDEIADQHLTVEEQKHKEHFFNSIFAQVGVF